jgi:membrane-associated HD superfamily phosphohydrolase
MTNNDIAWLSGLIVTLIPAVIYFILQITADYSPLERRARRLAILASVIVAAAILSATATVYSFVSELIGNFLMFPSLGLTAVAIWCASRITYQKTGGGKESHGSSSQEARTRS